MTGILERLGITTRVDSLLAWARARSLWCLPVAGGCCASRVARALRTDPELRRLVPPLPACSPRHSDVLVVAGRIPLKLAARLLRLRDEMPRPSWVIALGSCAASGGVFDTYPVVQGLDRLLPVDAFVPGCPPAPGSFLAAVEHVADLARRSGAAPRPPQGSPGGPDAPADDVR